MKVIGGAARPQLWVRATGSLQAQLLPGTANGDYPFWSPDTRYIGFFADSKLKKIAVTGGPAQTLCDAPNGRGGAWNEDGVILCSPRPTMAPSAAFLPREAFRSPSPRPMAESIAAPGFCRTVAAS